MPTIEELRARQAAHAQKLESVFFAKPGELAVRWSVDIEIVMEIPREALPYIEYGKSKARRYNPADVIAFEEREKQGAA